MSVVDDRAYDDVTLMIEQALERGCVYVHCWGGVGRTGTVIGCVLADAGLSFDKITTRIASLRRGSRKQYRQAPERPAQNGVIERRATASAWS